VYVDISGFLDKKLEAMKYYKTELRKFPHPRSLEGLELLARERGLGIGVEAAECFRLIREIV
jgi:LmbE family N-acetylglucosaminyl deacetylase